MPLNEEAWDTDECWLYDRLGKATTSEVEAFCSKVAERVSKGCEEAKARREILKELVEARRK